jgi:hypothetical protein
MKWLMRLLHFERVEIHVLNETRKRVFRFPFVWWSRMDTSDDEALREIVAHVFRFQSFAECNPDDVDNVIKWAEQGGNEALREDSLFQVGSFQLSSGIESSFRINAHRLTANDWKTLAHMAVSIVPPFSSVVGVPTGGLPFADALRPHARAYSPVLVVDDVLTTGASIRKVAQYYENPILLVAFSRASTHNDIFAVFTLGEAL